MKVDKKIKDDALKNVAQKIFSAFKKERIPGWDGDESQS
jgi:hypothetical protein